MRKITFILASALFAFALAACSDDCDNCCDTTPSTTPWDGVSVTEPTESVITYNGTPYNVYMIEEASDLAWFAQQVNSRSAETLGKSVYLTKDIDLGNKEWTPIGMDYAVTENQLYLDETAYTATPLFTGSIFGNGHTISNVSTPDKQSVARGVFGQVIGDAANPSVINDVHVENVTINGEGKWSGGLVGYVKNVKEISFCSVDGAVVKAGTSGLSFGCGGLVGFVTSNVDIDIKNCSTKNIEFPGDGWNNAGFIGKLWANTLVTIEDCQPSIGYCKTNLPLGKAYSGFTISLGNDGYNNTWFIGNITKTNNFTLTINNVADNSANWTDTDTYTNVGSSLIAQEQAAAYHWPYICTYDNYSNPALTTTITIDGTVIP